MNQHPECDARLKPLEDGLADVARRLRALADGRRAAAPTAECADTAPLAPLSHEASPFQI
jgi:hypothetical protein